MKKYNLSLDVIKHKYYTEKKSQQKISEELGVSQWVISDRLRKGGLQTLDRTRNLNPRRYDINHHSFGKLDEETAWLLGWMMSDGFVRDGNRFGLKVSAVDQDIIEKFRNYLRCTNPIYKHKQKLKQTNRTYHLVSIQISSKEIVERLAKFSIVPNKSLHTVFPRVISNQNEDIIRSFIRGVFEGDGSFLLEHKRSPLFQIVGTKELCYGIRSFLIKYIGIKATKLTQNIKRSNHYALRYRGRYQALKIMDWLYLNAKSKVLNRKFNRYLSIRRELCLG